MNETDLPDFHVEIYDLPEMKDEDDSKSFDQFLNSTTDF